MHTYIYSFFLCVVGFIGAMGIFPSGFIIRKEQMSDVCLVPFPTGRGEDRTCTVVEIPKQDCRKL